MKRFILDCGKRGSHVYNTVTKKYYQISHDDVVEIKIPEIKSGDIIIVEDAHMRSREKNSLAQPFDYEKLRKIYLNAARMGVEILLFPEQTTPTARKIAALKKPELSEKTDENDIKAIAIYLEIRPSAFDALKSFYPISLEEHYRNNKHKFEDREKLTENVNDARNEKYGVKNYAYSDAVTEWIKKYHAVLAERLNDHSLCEEFGLEFGKNGEIKKSVTKYHTPTLWRLYNCVVTILKPSGQLRVRSDLDLVPYWKYAKEVYFGLTPYHAHAGVTASNYKNHQRKMASPCKKRLSFESKNPIESPEEYEDNIIKRRSECDKKLRTVWREVRKMIVEENLR